MVKDSAGGSVTKKGPEKVAEEVSKAYERPSVEDAFHSSGVPPNQYGDQLQEAVNLQTGVLQKLITAFMRKGSAGMTMDEAKQLLSRILNTDFVKYPPSAVKKGVLRKKASVALWLNNPCWFVAAMATVSLRKPSSGTHPLHPAQKRGTQESRRANYWRHQFPRERVAFVHYGLARSPSQAPLMDRGPLQSAFWDLCSCRTSTPTYSSRCGGSLQHGRVGRLGATPPNWRRQFVEQ